MELKLNKMQIGAIAVGAIAQAVVSFVALRKLKKETLRADNAELMAWCRGCEIDLRKLQIKSLEKEITELKSKG